MTGNEYQTAAMRTMTDVDAIHPYGNLITGALGLSGESGEVADHIKKWFAQGHELNTDHLAEEIGDVLWYVAITANAIGYTLDDVMQKNVDKLRKRYPEGFDAERSIHRAG